MSSFKRKPRRGAQPSSTASLLSNESGTGGVDGVGDGGGTGRLRGSRPSVHNGCPLVSIGLTDVDQIFGGGLYLNTVTLVEEDVNTNHSKLLLDYFTAEGLACGQRVLVYTADAYPEELIVNLPSQSKVDGVGTTKEEEAPMKIAWRYQQQNSTMPSQNTASKRIGEESYCHTFDLSARVRSSTLEQYRNASLIGCFNVLSLEETPPAPSSSTSSSSPSSSPSPSPPNQDDSVAMVQQLSIYKRLYIHIANQLQRSFEENRQQVVRIVIHSLAAPMWSSFPVEDEIEKVIFLQSLRSLLHSYPGAVCLITSPTSLVAADVLTRMRHACDAVLHMSSFAGSGDIVLDCFRDYTGLLEVKRLPTHHTLVPFLPSTLLYGYTRGRKRLHVEQLHLPPEISRSQSAPSSAASSACAPGPPGQTNPLDF
eukprot:TRINITY_DN2136_c0_g1_i1.p1 TRINITY_DN2136_c0_g1~~TRINITY_DN2136_c0_g1_i1.p1  ORF type:complete len:424 (-),score=78.67 TRINITY_DN2136_c0_g1_i1:70-1341(-)